MAVDGEILAERMSFPVVRHHDPRQVGMIPEPHAEQVERLALVPIRAGPHWSYGIDLRIIAVQPAFKPQALAAAFHRMKEIDDLEARLNRIPVDAGNAAEAVELLVFLQKTGKLRRLRAGSISSVNSFKRNVPAVIASGNCASRADTTGISRT